MTIQQKLLRLLSYFTFKPIIKGYGVTTEPSESLCVKSDPDVPNIHHPAFYQLRRDIGPFEIRSIVEEKNKIFFILYNSMNDRLLKVSKEWFDFLFEEINDIEPNLQQFDNFKNRT
jgi:hypothetical protein